MIDQNKIELEAVVAAARFRLSMTEEEWAAQKASFVRGEIGMGSDRDEANYRKALFSGDKIRLQELDQEAEDRVKRAFRET